MKSWREKVSPLLAAYEASHQHPLNQLTHMVGIPLILFSPIFAVFCGLASALAAFVIGWVFQFVGHAIEGNRPKFFENPWFLVIGPLYFLLKWKR